MDLVRSCYSCPMRLQEGGPVVQVRWRFADKDADFIGVPTQFGSANWNLGEPQRFDSYLGEQAGARPWKDGSRPAGLIGKRLCFPVDWFREGVPEGVTISRNVERNLVPSCCQNVQEGKGGVSVSGKGKVTIGPCQCLDLPNTLTVTFAGAVAGVTSAIRVPSFCVWAGAVNVWAGIANYTVSFAPGPPGPGTWTLNIDCFTGPDSASATGSACSPLDVTVTVVDTQQCTNPLGGVYTARIQS
jgi:hypothetical protein